MRYIISFLLLFCFITKSNFVLCQDTIRLKTEPKVKLHGWYPNYNYVKYLKIGESKIIMTLTPDFESTKLRNCIIDLKTNNKDVIIKETGKIFPSQFIIDVNPTKEKYTQIDAWLLLENYTILIFRNNNWINIKDIFPVDGNKVKIDTIKLKIKK